MILREFRESDRAEAVKLFYRTVHAINARDYTLEQLDAWAPAHIDPVKWCSSFASHFSLVAIENGLLVGFGDVDITAGFLDRLYVHADFQRRGIASALCDSLERHVLYPTVTTHASVTAEPFFAKRGYVTLKKQQVECHGVRLTNFVMVKTLGR